MKCFDFFRYVQEIFYLENCFFRKLLEILSLGGELVFRGKCENFFSLKNLYFFQVSTRNFVVEMFLVEIFGRNLSGLSKCARWMWQKNPFPSIHMPWLIIECRHRRCKTASKFLSVSEHVEAVKKNKDNPLPLPAVLWILSVCKRKPEEKK